MSGHVELDDAVPLDATHLAVVERHQLHRHSPELIVKLHTLY